MKIIEEGHVYLLSTQDGIDGETVKLTFVNREEGKEHCGTQTQEVLRALIDRTMHCDNCLPWEDDKKIIYHLRMALVYHEARALIRKAEKGLYNPEEIQVAEDGHFKLSKIAMDKDNIEWNKRIIYDSKEKTS